MKSWKKMNRGILLGGIVFVGVGCYVAVDQHNFKSEKPSIRPFTSNSASAYALSAVKSAKLSVLALDMRGKDLKSYNAKGNVAIIVGGEANGLTEEAKAGADEIISIKMEAQSESLNAAVALSIAMYTLKK